MLRPDEHFHIPGPAENYPHRWLFSCIEFLRMTVSSHHAKAGAFAAQRRSQRILLTVPLSVSGISNGVPFAERTEARVLNAHGALVVLHQPVALGQELRLRNLISNEEQSCTVVDINPGHDGEREVGVQFVEPEPHFWHVAFPPADWTPRDPEAKRIASPHPAETRHKKQDER